MSRKIFWISILVAFTARHLVLILMSHGAHSFLSRCRGEPAPSACEQALIGIATYGPAAGYALAGLAVLMILYLRSRRVQIPRHLVVLLVAAGIVVNLYATPAVILIPHAFWGPLNFFRFALLELLEAFWFIGIGVVGVFPDKEEENAPYLTLAPVMSRLWREGSRIWREGP